MRALSAVSAADITGALDLCAASPVEGVSLAHQLLRWNSWGRGDVMVAGRPGRPDAAAWATGSLMPFGFGGREDLGLEGVGAWQIKAMADHARKRLTNRGSVFGPAVDVEPLWLALEAGGMRAREVRSRQPLLVSAPGSVVADVVRRRPQAAWAAVGLRAAVPDEHDKVLAAAVDMFIGELGYDPRSSGGAYSRHVEWLISGGCSYVVMDDGHGGVPALDGDSQVAFKVDVGALWKPEKGPAVAQLTGVWTRPNLRGSGVAAAALAAAVDQIRVDHVGQGGIVSLYVNDFNHAARALYRSLGFRQVGTFATVLL